MSEDKTCAAEKVIAQLLKDGWKMLTRYYRIDLIEKWMVDKVNF